MAVAVAGAVLHSAGPQLPGVAAVRLPVRGLQELDAVSGRGAVFVALEQLGRDGVVEDEAAGAHQVLGVAVVDGAVVGELVEVAAALAVNARGMIEVDDALDVIAEHLGIAVVHGTPPALLVLAHDARLVLVGAH